MFKKIKVTYKAYHVAPKEMRRTRTFMVTCPVNPYAWRTA